MCEHRAGSWLMTYGNELGPTADHIPPIVKKEEAHHGDADRGRYRADGGDRHRGDRAKRACQLSRNCVELRANAADEPGHAERRDDPVEARVQPPCLLHTTHNSTHLLPNPRPHTP